MPILYTDRCASLNVDIQKQAISLSELNPLQRDNILLKMNKNNSIVSSQKIGIDGNKL